MASDLFITALDLGSYYIKASAVTGGDGDIVFSAYGESQGIEDGRVTDSVRLLSGIRSVLRQLEIKTGAPVTKVFLNIDTAYTRQESSRGSAGLKTGIVTEGDMLNAVKGSMRVAKTSTEQICDVLVGEYRVDGAAFVNPKGVRGGLIDVSAQTILTDKETVEGQAAILEHEGIQVLGTGLSVHGMAGLMLTKSQRHQGALLIDAGHRKTDLVVLKDNRIAYSETIPLGGRTITKDLSIVLKVSMNEAESLKKQLGTGELKPSHPKYDLIQEVVAARASEILSLCRKSFEKSGLSDYVSQALVYGGGLCGFQHVAEFSEDGLGISTIYITSDIIKSDDIFSLNATGCARNMIHEIQSGLIAQLWEDAGQQEDPEDAGSYLSVFDKVRQKAGMPLRDKAVEEDRAPVAAERAPRSHEDFRKKAGENSIGTKLKKIFGIIE